MSREERIRILSLLEEGKINADEATRLLDAVTPAPAESAEPVARAEPAADRGKVHVQVTDTTTGATRLHFAVPAAVARLGLRLVAAAELSDKFAETGISEADLDRVQEAVAAGTTGTVLEVDDTGDGYRVEVWIE